MKTKFFVLVICLSFALLITMSGTIMVSKGMCQWYVNGSTEQGYGAIGHIVAGALTNIASTGAVVAGSLLHRSGFSSMSIPGQNNLQHSWGIQVADYYFHDFFLDPLMGLRNYMNYIQGLQFGSQGSSIAPSGFPTFTSSAYNLSLPSMEPPDLNWLNGLNAHMALAIPWQSIFDKSVPGYNYDAARLKKTSPIISDIGPGGIGIIPGQMWGIRSSAPSLIYYWDI